MEARGPIKRERRRERRVVEEEEKEEGEFWEKMGDEVAREVEGSDNTSYWKKRKIIK